MWKRPDEVAVPPPVVSAESPRPVPITPPTPGRVPAPSSPARLGPSLALEGKLSGEEDLLVEGRFKGEIQVPAHQVTVGSDGRVEGEVRANAIVVEGEVRGNLSADTRVEILPTGSLTGTVKSASFTAADGATVKGEVWVERAAPVGPAGRP